MIKVLSLASKLFCQTGILVCLASLLVFGIASAEAMAQAQDNLMLRQTAERMVSQIFESNRADTARGPAILGPKAAALSGSWQGVFTCNQTGHRAQLEIAVIESGALTAEFTQWETGGSASDSPTKRALWVTYQPQTGSIELAPASPIASGSRASQQGFAAPDASVLLLTGDLAGDCSPMTFRRATTIPAEWKFFERILPPAIKRQSALQLLMQRAEDFPRQLFSRDCPAGALPWIRQLSEFQGPERGNAVEQWNLFADPFFVPHFGKSFFAYSDAERKSLGEALKRNCTDRSPEFRDAWSRLFAGVVDSFGDDEKSPRLQVAATGIAQAEIRRWTEQVQRVVVTPGEVVASPELIDYFLKLAEPLLHLIWAKERDAFVRSLQDSKQGLLAAGLASRIRGAASKEPERLRHLDILSKEVAQARSGRGGSRISETQARELELQLDEMLERESLGAAAQLAESYSAPVQMDFLKAWSTTYSGLYARLQPRTRQQIEAIFNDRRGTLAKTYADEERTTARSIASDVSRPEIARLRALVTRQREIDELFAPYLNGPEWQALQVDLVATRQPLLAAAVPELARLIQTTSQRGEVERLINAHVAHPDRGTAAGRAVIEQTASGLQAIAPFAALQAGQYFDAIFGGDFDRARTIDMTVAAEFRAGIRDGANRLLALPPDTRGDPISEAFLTWSVGSRSSLAYAIGSAYLVNYEVRPTQRCLGSNPRRVTISTTTIERGRDALGAYERVVGRSSRDVAFKSDLTALSELVNLSDPGSATILSSLFSTRAAGAVSDALRGTGQMMQTFPCDSAAVQRFERQLLAYLQTVRAR